MPETFHIAHRAHRRDKPGRPTNCKTGGLALLILTLVSGCARSPVLEPLDAPGRVQAQTFVLECERNFAFVARSEGDAIWLFLPNHAVQLPREAGEGSGLYSGAGIRFSYHDGRAQLELPDDRYIYCQNNRRRATREHAKLNGVDFRATGIAPDWSLEITLDDHIDLVTLSDGARYQFVTPEPTILEQARKTLYSAQNKSHQIIVELINKPCHDASINETLDITVSIRLDEQSYQGCGEALH